MLFGATGGQPADRTTVAEAATALADLVRVSAAEAALGYDHPEMGPVFRGDHPPVAQRAYHLDRHPTRSRAGEGPRRLGGACRRSNSIMDRAASVGAPRLWRPCPTVESPGSSATGPGQPVSVRLPFPAQHVRTGDKYPEGHLLHLAARNTTVSPHDLTRANPPGIPDECIYPNSSEDHHHE
jgi:hypothetical protein